MVNIKENKAVNNVLSTHMGEAFQELSPLLQKFHTGKKSLNGKVDVVQGNALAKVLCWFMRFPKQGKSIELLVECDHGDEGMSWKRRFGDHVMASTFFKKGEYLVERLNGLQLSLKAIEEQGALVYEFSSAKYFGLPLPSILCPKVEAYEQETDGKYEFYVNVDMWLLGKVISYWGALELTDE